MVKIIIIDKSGNNNSINVKDISLNNLYKKCGFRKIDNFEKRTTWKIKHNSNNVKISVFSKNTGRANTENKFEFPPPIDNELYFGSVALVLYRNKLLMEDALDLSEDMWCKIYEKLMGGFIDLGEKDTTSEEDEYENIPKEELTKQGYHKDGFIVESEEETEEEEIGTDNEGTGETETEEEEEEEESSHEYESYESSNESVPNSDIESPYSSDLESSNNESELTEEEYLSE